MLKWLLTVFLVLLLIAWAAPGLGRIGLGRLPGDLRIPYRGRLLHVPLASTLVLSALVYLLGRLA